MGSLISIGTKALAASSAALQTTGHNIANANTKGYSKQSVELETAGGRYTGLGFFGDGVNVTNIKRDHDEFLTREASITTSVAASDEARLKQLEQMEKIFGLGEAGIGDAAGKFFNAFADVVSKPQDLTARQVVLSRAGDLVTRFRTSAERLDSLQAGVSQDIKVSIAAVNSLTSEIASLNEKIARMESTGKAPNDLLDQRDLSLSKLSELIQITTLKASDGTLGVFMGGGQQLVLGQRATLLSAVPNVYDPAKVQVAINDSAGVRPLENYLFTGGSVAGLLRFQSTDITDARNLIGQMATAISDRMNQQQALGLDLGAASSGAPIFSMTSGRVLPNIQNALAGGVPVASYLDPGGNRVSSVSFSVADATQLRASDYELEVTGASAGPYQLRRLVDNVVRSVHSGDTIDGFKLQIQPTALPASGDKFLIQPVGQGSSTLTLAMSDPRGLAAAAPVTATKGVNNTGTVAVTSIHAVTAQQALNPLTADIQFTDNAGNYAWSLRDTNNAVVRSGTATWQPAVPITSASWTPATPPQRNDWSMTLTGVPKSGDTFTIAPTKFPAANNGNAAAMLAIRDAGIVGQEIQPGPPPVTIPGSTATDAYAKAVADVGVRVQSAKSAAEQSMVIASEVQAQLADKVGVNLDEEAARLIQFQQSYQASAKVLQIAQSLMDTILQLGR